MTTLLRFKIILITLTFLILTGCGVDSISGTKFNNSSSGQPEGIVRLGFEIDTNTLQMNLTSVEGSTIDASDSIAKQAINPTLAFSFLNTATNTGNCVPANPIPGAGSTLTVEFCFLNNASSTFDHFEYRIHTALTTPGVTATHNGVTLPLDTIADTWLDGQASFDHQSDGSLATGDETTPQPFVIKYTTSGTIKFFIDVLAVEQLTPGDIAILGYNADTSDDFSFVALADIPKNTEIFFTDKGWLNSGGFRTGEGIKKFTASSLVSKGTVIKSDNVDFSSISGSLNFAAAGDQLISYVMAGSNPLPIFAFHSAGTGFTDATSSNTSGLPTGLTLGTTAIEFVPQAHNMVYDLSVTTGTKAVLLTAINDLSNYKSSNTTQQTMPSSPATVFTVN